MSSPSPSSSPSSSTSGGAGFNPNQTPDSTQSITVNYLPMGLTGVLNDPNNYCISALCSKSSTPNVTYSNSSGQQQFMANKLWIVGNAQGSLTPLHSVQGIAPGSVNGELIVQNINTNGDQVLYTCFLLCVTATAIPGAEQIDNILNVTPQNNTLTVDLGAAINSKPVSNPAYIQYQSTVLGPNNPTVIIFTQPIWITSVNLFTLQNNLGLFDMPMPSTPSNYAVIPLNVPGSWMECDYVPIDGGEVTTYNLPISSDLVKSGSMFSSLQTVILFIVFFFLCAMSYFIVPAMYLAVIYRVLGRSYLDQNEKRTRILWADIAISAILAGTAIILICVGTFAPPASVTNSGDILLSGFSIGIIYIISYIIIQAKKSGGRFIEGVKYDYMDNA